LNPNYGQDYKVLGGKGKSRTREADKKAQGCVADSSHQNKNEKKKGGLEMMKSVKEDGVDLR